MVLLVLVAFGAQALAVAARAACECARIHTLRHCGMRDGVYPLALLATHCMVAAVPIALLLAVVLKLTVVRSVGWLAIVGAMAIGAVAFGTFGEVLLV